MQLPGITPEALQAWLLANIQRDTGSLSAGNQGSVLLCHEAARPLVIKIPASAGLLQPLYHYMLRREYRVYRRLAGIPGIPHCYGLLQNRYLVLEYIEGNTLRQGEPDNRERFYDHLFTLIESIHQRGVAHMDLKRKENILIDSNGLPVLIDFGAACKRRTGFRPLNHYFFYLGRRFDLNAWLKHKYRRQYQQVSEGDRGYLHRTRTERMARRLKSFYRKLCNRRHRS